MNPDSPASISATDQAEGLRNIFGQPYAKAYVLASALDADSTVAIGLGTAHSLRKADHKVLLIDEVPLNQRQGLAGFSYPVQYDLGQAFSNLIGIEKCIREVDENLWFASSARIHQYFKTKKTRGPALDIRLHQLGMNIDYFVIATTDPFNPVLSLYSKEINYIVIASVNSDSLVKTLGLIKELTLTGTEKPIPVMMVGGLDRKEGEQAFERLKTAATQYLEQPIELLCWVGATSLGELSTQETDTTVKKKDLLLPAGLFKQMANKIAS
ncbi:hypothetical protein ICN28_04545 [Polynucleobacter sp. 30F-ANTBAC]|jgi:hypothetical protein|uniref:MinD/ParA family ATP-binding protein n=1 Tax=Polynucleobacter sp. 30F-ANTBAC TaxID=2689095 RepID=UPI001C0B081F|nr:hypothetical protein [Polynucleobacter sp. 30F-ANTBAC]MBU3599784.1 hypothetical protein [Polynucleobacter sp. 30F-ANTBAC]